MCAIPDKATTERFRARRTTQRAYKVLHREDARPVYFARTRKVYRRGHNADPLAARTFREYELTNRGLHCYLARKDAVEDAGEPRLSSTVVAVTFKPIDVIAAEEADGDSACEIVVRALHISERAWKQAGLPKRKGNNC